jgi:uncharacterized protein (TIGR03067 family)
LLRSISRSAVSFSTGPRPSGVPSSFPQSLAEKVSRVMYVKKIKAVCAVFLAASLALGGAFSLAPGKEETNDPPKPNSATVDAKVVAPADKEPAPIRGTWTMTAVEEAIIDGKPQPPKKVTRTVVITNDRIKLLDSDGFVAVDMTFKFDQTAKPAAIDLTDPQVGLLQGIFRLDGDRLQIAYGIAERPTKFPTERNAEASDIVWELKRVSLEPKTAVQRFPNAPGWNWMLTPAPPVPMFASNGLVLLFDKDADGSAVITLASAAAMREQPKAPEYQPVLFDAEKRRFNPAIQCGGSSASQRNGAMVSLMRWRMDPKMLPAGKIAFLGIEQMTKEEPKTAK